MFLLLLPSFVAPEKEAELSVEARSSVALLAVAVALVVVVVVLAALQIDMNSKKQIYLIPDPPRKPLLRWPPPPSPPPLRGAHPSRRHRHFRDFRQHQKTT